jgi:radical SAM protein with 4Fe4S-binding SPASM domain
MDMLPEFKFSFAVVFPSQSGRVDYVRLNNLEDFSNKIISMISFLKEKAGEKNFRAVFAKPYPPCFFSEEDLKFILKNVEYKNVCEIDKNSYTNNTCINPDLSYFPCVALTADRYRGEKIPPFDQLKTENKARAGFLVHKALLEECGNCRLFHLGVCQAACYAYVG